MAAAIEIRKGRVPVYIHTSDAEPEAIDQLVNLSRLEIMHDRVVAMPDVHAGIGATVGSVIPTKSAIVPAAVGVDIGCGMIAVLTSLMAKDLPESLRIDAVMENQKDLVVPIHTLKQVLCIKG